MVVTARLYVVATPIGNLGDITLRALDVLRAAPVIAAEDTRHVRKLLAHFDIPTPRMLSYREENRERATAEIVEILQAGQDVALVSDAGTPVLSDPGDVLVARCHDLGLPVVPVPGASALLAALVASGLPSTRFTFEGFLSRRTAHRRERLAALASEERTMVFYEAPSRVAETLRELAEVFGGDRAACAARELTKKFEEIRRATLDELAAWAGSNEMRGEFVLVVQGGQGPPPAEAADAETLLRELMAEGASHKDAAREVARRLNLPRRDVYNLISGGSVTEG